MNLPTQLRMQLEQPLDGMEALDDALRVIEPVDADADLGVGRNSFATPRRGDGIRQCSAAGRRMRDGHWIEMGNGSMLVRCPPCETVEFS